jgi:hypothetical protein
MLWKRKLILPFLLLSIFVRAQTAPLFSVVTQQTFACTNQPLLLSAVSSSNNLSYTWSVTPAKYASLSSSTGTTVVLTVQKDLTYTITISATDGATVTVVKKPLTCYKSAKASFNASLTSAGYPANLILTNYSSYAKEIAWKFSDRNQADSSFNIERSYSQAGSYSVTLFAVGQKDSSSVVLPNVFTPNRDEINDVFRPVTTGLVALSGWVFSREGAPIYNWNTINGSWDGRTVSGELCPEGVYFVIVEATGFDGKTFKKKSFVTLLR